jgi:hypothetical protein
MICRAAKSVRIVVVTNSAALDTLSHLLPVTILIESLFVNPQGPILWVFNNDRSIARPLTAGGFTKAMQRNRRCIDCHYEIRQQLLRLAGVSAAPPAISSLKQAIDGQPCRVSYIDPASSWSVTNLLHQIEQLPPIPMSNIRRFSQSIESMDIDYRQLFADFQVIR